MPEQFYQPIETQFGILRGRDTIYIDTITLSLYPGQFELSGKINGHNASRNTSLQDLNYAFTFHHVLALKMIELDSWNWACPACFAEVIHSEWVAQLHGKVTPEDKHYLLQTYDDVFDIVCRSFSLKMIPFKSGPD